MNELLVRLELFGLVTFLDRSREVSFAVESHSESELGIKVVRLLMENSLKLFNSHVEVALAKGKHGIVKLFLKRHNPLTMVGIARLLAARKTSRSTASRARASRVSINDEATYQTDLD